MTNFSDEEISAALKAIEERMSNGAPFTYGGLCKCWPEHDRLIDKTIQRWRRKGLISFVRIGRDTRWSLTEDGRSKVNNDGDGCAHLP